MIVLSASNINKSYGIDVVLEDISFHVNKGDRVGIVGPNGAGKTTLLSILAGELSASSGNVYIRSECTLGYLKQKNHFFSEGTVIEEAEKNFEKFYNMEKEIDHLAEAISDHTSPSFDSDLAKYSKLLEDYKKAGGYTYKSELRAVLKNMGFDEEARQKKIEKLSGGERTRLALSCMLLKKPDILLLDEPTNHLDLSMLAWLENYLKAYNGTLLVVSHDRYFLDRLVNRIFDVQGGELTDYKGNYSEFLVKREERLQTMLKEYEKQQKEIARQEEIIRRFKQHNTEHLVKRAQSREKRLAQLEILQRPDTKQAKLKLSFDANFRSGNDVVIAENLSKSFKDKHLFSNVSMDIKKGEKICIIGDNGIGKTTLMKILLGREQADDGYLKIGYNVQWGYYDQGQLLLDDKETVLGEMKNAYHLYTDTEMRSLLGRFLFFGDDVFKKVGSLSGGEKAKLSLLKLMLSGANTLILDEPTNHLDIDSKEIVEDAIAEFVGTVIIVSHDRFLLSKIPDRILELTEDGLVEYKGKFDYYLEKSEAQSKLLADSEGSAGSNGTNASDRSLGSAGTNARTEGSHGSTGKVASDDRKVAAFSTGNSLISDNSKQEPLSSRDDRQLRKQQEAEERRRQRKASELEDRIHKLEEQISELEAKMCEEENATNAGFMREASAKLSELKEELDTAYAEYLELDSE